MNINVFSNYYNDPSQKRREELNKCIRHNQNNIYLNVVLIESDNRMKYDEFFKIVNEYTLVDDINIISNLDIYFDQSVELLKNMSDDEAFALGRWELTKDGNIKFANRHDSQDAWVFKGHIRNVLGDFYLGHPGCDNRVAHEIGCAGYRLSNPAKTIRAIHVHTSNIRNYATRGKKRKAVSVKGPYKTISPTEWTKRK